MIDDILIIDSDTSTTNPISLYLQNEGYKIIVIENGEDAIKVALNQSFDIIILEITLPDISGLEVLRTIRKHSDVGVIILTQQNKQISKLVSLEIGADDFITKPCTNHELMARIRAILRRSKKVPEARSVIKVGNITVDCIKHQVSIDNNILELTNTEFNIIEMLVKSPGQAFSKEELTEYAIGRKFTAFDRSVDVHISNLRHKLGKNSQGDEILQTVRGFGYVFNA